MNTELLRDLALYQVWADAEHWKALKADAKLMDDPDIRKRLGHMATASQFLVTLARGETPDRSKVKEQYSIEEVEAEMGKARELLSSSIGTIDLDKMISLPRGPKGPFEAPAGVLLLQALLHSQHHRAQNASRMRELGVTPPMTDYVIWYALGRP